jgi:site-specific DNA recombinase
MSEQKIFRCAVYTRKSSEEGLEQDFNSLEAQREACEAYIRSQSHEGWKLIPDRFDDGGFSGGNMDRPALGKLMSMIRDGKVDVIVIYKIDRLTRSLTDFARLAETFDKYGVSFVSVTQQFNTTTSMGRLMLNVLLSFAQFEREITGERIRDKIAASKKKGMWMGGPVPMGYNVKDRQLVINETEAESVRRVFELYIDEGHVPALLERLMREGIRTPVRTSAMGSQRGGRWFTRGHVYKLLSNPLYIGRVAHKGSSHPGQHEAIVDRKTWDAVQTRLAKNTQGERQRRKRATAKQPLLADLVVTPAGHRLIPTHCTKAGRRYEYYVEQSVAETSGDMPTLEVDDRDAALTGANRRAPRRLPGPDLERAITTALSNLFGRPEKLIDMIGSEVVGTSDALPAAAAVAQGIASGDAAIVRDVVECVAVARSTATITLNVARTRARLRLSDKVAPGTKYALDAVLGSPKRGRQVKLIVGARASAPGADPTLVTAVARAFDWFDRLASGKAKSIAGLAEEDGFDGGYVSHLLRVAFLSPGVVEDITAGRQREGMVADKLIWSDDVQQLWSTDR